MKPQKLILCGWGPYREKQEIDFTKLQNRGLFLITGATGAGKTTVFDAITYALYGTMSGTRREKSTVRSDFAAGETPTYVELFMEHGQKEYHIYRNPEYMRPKKRKGSGDAYTREKERAVLTLPDGEKLEGSSEVTRKIQELLRLDYKQFKQLSMIAQGEFAKLLTATSSEKSKIFREIFDTEIYDRMAGELRVQSGRLYTQVMEYRHKMEEDISFFVPQKEEEEDWQNLQENGIYVDGMIAFLEESLKKQKKQTQKLEQELAGVDGKLELLTVQQTEGEQIKALYEALEKEEEKHKQLSLQRQEYCTKETDLSKTLWAEEVYVLEEKLSSMMKIRKESREKIKQIEEELRSLQQVQEEEGGFYQQAEVLTKAYSEEEKGRSLALLLQEQVTEWENQQVLLKQMQQSYLKAEKEEEIQKAAFEEADKSYRHAIAGILAQALTEGDACPVCGSVHHPGKASLHETVPSKEMVDTQKAVYEKKRENRIQIHGKTTAGKEKADLLFKQKEETEAALADYRKREENRPAFVKTYLLEHSEKEFLLQKQNYEARCVMLLQKEDACAERKQEAEAYQSREDMLRKEFEQKRKQYFESEAAYRQAFLEKKQIQKLQEDIADYQRKIQANETAVSHFTGQLAGRRLMDLEALKQQILLLKSKKDVLLKETTEKNYHLKTTQDLHRALLDKQGKMQTLSARYGLVKRLDDTACGNNRLRLVFEQYVLSAYFEEILKAANIRLKVMSMGRYELKRMESVGDGRSKDNLEMEVLDFYTGKYRSVKTLSGGELFKVSLSLALGMSDIVQALSGGIRVEALFIDEGFGSLDSESLEQACLTLQSLVEKDRLIGIISHVPELSEKITNKIKIHKTNNGSTVEVMVS